MQTAWAFQILPPNPGVGNIESGLPAYLWSFEDPARTLFWGILFFFLFIYAAVMVFNSHDESAMAESKLSYSYAVAGVIVVSVATMIANTVTPGTGNLVASGDGTAESAILNVISYAEAAISIALIANIVIQGFRLIFSGGEQEYIDRARKRLIYSFVGIALVLIARAIVAAVDPGHGHDLGILTLEMKGIANFLLTLFGVSVVVAIIVAGIMLVVSVDESLKDKAKNVIKTSILALIIILLSYVLVNAFISVPIA